MQSLGEVATENDKEDREKVAKFLKADAEARADGKEGVEGEAEDEENASSTAHLSERIANLDLDDEEDLDRLWDALTPAEKAEFESQLRSGEAAKWLVEGGAGNLESPVIVTPWWRTPLIVENDNDAVTSTSSSTVLRPTPRLFAHVKPLSALTNQKPSPTIAFNLVNVLFSYVYCWRLYNGDHGESTEAAAEFLRDFCAICGVVGEGKEAFYSVAASLCGAVTRLGGNGGEGEERALFCSNDFTAETMEDVAVLCAKGKETVARALSDVRSVVKMTVKSKKSGNPSSDSDKKRFVSGIVKKLEYFLSWVAEFGDERLGELAGGANREAMAYRKKIQSVQIASRMRESEED